MKQPVYGLRDQSFTTLDYTYAFDKYSCVSWMYPIHIISAYIVVLTGFLAIISRVVPKIRPYHMAFGRLYLIFMLWTMASSLLIHNAGLPTPILVSFVYLLVSITIGWNAIRLHVNSVAQKVRQIMQDKINAKIEKGGQEIDLKAMENQERNNILVTKTFRERVLSPKMVHGVLMSFSWCQMLGRTMVTNPFTTFSGCWTYPAYKSTSIDGTVYALDSQASPSFPMPTGLFLVVITVPTVIILLLTALISTYCIYKQDVKDYSQTKVSPSNSDNLNN